MDQPSVIESFWRVIGNIAVEDREVHLSRLRNEAPLFNALTFFKSGEVVATEMLAFLLTPTAPHGQGDAFLIELLRILGVFTERETISHVMVETNAPCYVSRSDYAADPTSEKDRRRMMDIVIRFSRELMHYVVVIESKSHDAADQDHQIHDYLRYIKRTYPQSQKHLIYLADGWPPSPESIKRSDWDAAALEGVCHAKSYPEVTQLWIEKCVSICDAPKVTAFLKDFAHFIELEAAMTNRLDGQTSEKIEGIINSTSEAGIPPDGELEALLAVYGLHEFVWEKAVTAFMCRLSEQLQQKLYGWEVPEVHPKFNFKEPYIYMSLRKPSWGDKLHIYLGTQDAKGRCYFDLAVFKNEKHEFRSKTSAEFDALDRLRIGPRSNDFTIQLFPNGVADLRSVDGVRALLTDQAINEIASEVMRLIVNYEPTMDNLFISS